MIKNILDFLLLPFDLLFKKFALRNNIGFLPPVQPTHQKFPLIILGGEYAIKHQIPTSVIFNTGSGPITVGNNETPNNAYVFLKTLFVAKADGVFEAILLILFCIVF